MTTNADVVSAWSQVMMANYGTPQIAIARGEGARVWDVEGREYLDLVGGIAVSSLGHAHPAVIDAITRQASTLMHTSNLYLHEPGIALAQRLVELLGVDAKVFLCQDGATANEAAYKIVRAHWHRSTDPTAKPRTEMVAFDGSFHGRTLGALSITGSAVKRVPFEPLPGPVHFVEYGNVNALEAAVGRQTAAVFVEPIQGENGVVLPPDGYLQAVRAICDRTGAVMVVDEVQSGIGRTGSWFMSREQQVTPDIVTLAKGLAGGFPIGACLATGELADTFRPGDHGTTFGGNPVGCAAALAVIDTIEHVDLLAHVREVGALWADGFADIAQRSELVTGSRGVGLWHALTLADGSAKAVENAAAQQGFLVNAVKPNVIRLAPPLILTVAQAQTFLEALPAILAAAQAGVAA
jgi:acetylornithine/N-succinyldiaminopimelate aminotransferase